MHNHRVLFLCPSLVGAGVERRVYLLINQLNLKWSHLKLGLLRQEGEFLDKVDPELRLCVTPGRLIRFFCAPLKQLTELYHFLLAIGQIHAMLKTYKPAMIVSFTLETTLPMYLVRLVSAHKTTIWIISEDSNTALAAGNATNIQYLNKLLQHFLGIVYRNADYITTVSSAVQHSVENIYRIPLERSNVINNPVDIETIQRLGNKALSINNRPFKFDYIIAVGRLVKIKQFDLLIKAYSQLNLAGTTHLVILGEGPENLRLQKLVSQLGLTDVIHFPGYVEQPWLFMKHAKLLVLTSKLEGFGNVIVEAMAVACPVIATDCGGPEDIIHQNINGLIVPNQQNAVTHAIEKLLNNPEFANRLSNQALKDVRQFHPQTSCSRFNDMLLEVQHIKEENSKLGNSTI